MTNVNFGLPVVLITCSTFSLNIYFKEAYLVDLDEIRVTLIIRCNYYGNYGVAKGFDPQSAANVLKGTDTLYLIRGKHFTSKKPLKLTDSTAWIGHGATKFYIYHHSISKEVDTLLKIYENDPNIEIERVLWGLLPVPKYISYEEDPNNHIMHFEQILGWNNCILRARGKTKYLALSDFDETFVVFTSQTLLSVLDEVVKKDPDAGSFMFRNTFGEFKVIVIPERVKMQQIHYTRLMETFYSKRYIPPNISKFFHFRLLLSWSEKELLASDNTLARQVPKWNLRYRRMLEGEIGRLEEVNCTDDLTLKTNWWTNISLKLKLSCLSRTVVAWLLSPAFSKCAPVFSENLNLF
ncbi:unnamed protein product [Enterobius vermicularis]|uniref:Glycosyltransferase family 92 protein n=1 Tax=Enterobius vermicularis TaxID=51028 RepID=A0A0N4UYR0_ENTVE|nr:unnamed protein product [Enterobius vermicularis]